MKERFRIYAWSVLAFQLMVILWGAWVRVSGSGAGCGEHWPLCNGEVVPSATLSATVIEFVHRVTSGIAVISVLVLVVWAFLAFPRRAGVRGAALLTVVSIFIESAIGAALVLLRLVGSNESFSRGVWLGAHLINTLFLLAALSFTAWMATAARRTTVARAQPKIKILSISIVGFLTAGVLGTFAALGDTLTIPTSFTEGIHADFSAFSSIFVRLRILHPVAACALGIWLLALVFKMIASEQVSHAAKRLSGTIAGLVLFQFAVGVANIILKTPAWTQLLHLLGADLLWIACVLLAAELYPRVRVDSNEPVEARPVAIATVPGSSGVATPR